jgi:alpha-D-xyloside xylohydrolase
LFPEIIQKGLFVKDSKGNLPYEDAVLDFSNPDTVKWYQEKIGNLIKMGVGAIKVDFGEAAPLTGVYASGRTGFYEHNLYPLRYNKVVADITKQISGENIIWARSAWAGSQRYPLHWGGDAGTIDVSMASELRGGLSFGLSGFTFWSHDIGGFAAKTPEELYRRWMPFGMLTSHSRCHGNPPKEPWEYSAAFMDDFRRADEMKYKLMPYVYAQAKDSSERGLPMVRALFVEYPNDPGSWMVEDEYLFGSDILVAPLLDANATGRDVYLPPGQWIDYQTGKVYSGGWQNIQAGVIPVVMLVREGAVIAHMKLAQSTKDMDWANLDLVVYATNAQTAQGVVCLPSDNVLRRVSLPRGTGNFALAANPLAGRSTLTVKMYSSR